MNARTLLIAVSTLLVLAGCQQVADVSALPAPYQGWAVEAFAIEGVDSCIHCDGPSIEVLLDPTLTDPFTGETKSGFADVARGRLRIRFRIETMSTCGTGSIETKFKSVSRHEARHFGGAVHDSRPNRLMHDPAPCYPVD